MKRFLSFCLFFSSSMALAVNFGLKKPADADYGVPFLSLQASDETLPEKFDLREKGLVSPIRNQGGCGSCWSFSTLDAMESNALVQGEKQLFLSTQELVNCQFSGCGGGYFAFDFIQKYGVTTASELPYKGRNGRCAQDFTEKHYVSQWFRLGKSRSRPTADDINAAIYKYGAVSITAYASRWGGYTGGVKGSCRNGGTNHMVTLVGFDRPAKTWVLKNSWGTSWGQKGYGYFPYFCDNTGEEAAVGIYKKSMMDLSEVVTLPKTIKAEGGKLKLKLPVASFKKAVFYDETGEVLAVDKHLDVEAQDIREVHLEVETEYGLVSSKAKVLE